MLEQHKIWDEFNKGLDTVMDAFRATVAQWREGIGDTPKAGQFVMDEPVQGSADWYANLGNDPGNRVNPLGMDSENPLILFADPTADNPSQMGKQGRISYPMAGLPDIGPCTYRSLLGIAETRSGNNLSPAQIRQGVKDLQKSGTLDDWMVDSQEDIINYGLSILGSDENAEWISRSLNFDKNGTMPEGAEASLVKNG